MGVVGTRVSLALEQTVQNHCRGLGKTPSVWLRELIEREISGKAPSPAVGEAIQEVNKTVLENAQLIIGLLGASLGIYNTLLQEEIFDHPERAEHLERQRHEFVLGLVRNLPLKEKLTVDIGVRVSDLLSEIERIKAEKKEA